jgi:CubicO group peptidase (beta-lactamase class C family)
MRERAWRGPPSPSPPRAPRLRGAFAPWLVLALACLTTTWPAAATEQPSSATEAVDPRITEVEHFIETTWAQRPHAGMTVGISAPGVRWVKGYGLAHLKKKRPAKATTSYRMASVTKMMTAVAVMQLVERGRIDLDAEVQRYVPSFPTKSAPVTVRHLLGHLSGISHYQNRTKEAHFQRPYTTAESLAVFQDWPLVAAPGERYVYTSYGYNLLGAIVEARSGMSYDRYLKRKVFRPLGIRGAGVEQRAAKKRSWAQGYKLVGDTLRRSESIDITSRFAGGGTRATVADMVRFGEGLLGGELVSPESLALMQEPMATTAGEIVDYGMGMASYPLGGRWVIAHAGSQAETSTLLMMFPAEGLIIAIAQNLEDQWTPNHKLAGRIAEVFLLGGERRRGLAATDVSDHMMMQGLTRVYSHGLGQYRLRSGRIDDGVGDVLRAFRTADALLVPETLGADPAAGFANIQLALGPKTDRALPKVGAYMAAVLVSAGGPTALDGYGPTSTIAFVRDYLEACASIDCPDGLLPSPAVQAFVRRVDAPLAEAYPDTLRQWRPSAADDPDAVGERLRDAFRGAPVVPDFAWELREIGEQLLFDGDVAKASAWLELGRSLYPQDTRTALALGLVRYAGGDHARGDLMMNDAARLPEADKLLTAAKLRYTAWRLEKTGFKPGGRDLVAWAAEHHATDESLWKLLAKKRAALGDKAGAEEARARAQGVAAATDG